MPSSIKVGVRGGGQGDGVGLGYLGISSSKGLLEDGERKVVVSGCIDSDWRPLRPTALKPSKLPVTTRPWGRLATRAGRD